jgi:hypothetical protein
LLHAVPENLEQVVISMETLLYLKSLSLEEVVGHLHPVETRKKPPPMKESEGRLLLTDDEWLARVKTRDGSGGGGNKGKGAKQSTQGGRKMLAGRVTSVPTVARRAIGPKSVTRRNTIKRPRPMWLRLMMKRSRASF